MAVYKYSSFLFLACPFNMAQTVLPASIQSVNQEQKRSCACLTFSSRWWNQLQSFIH